MSVPAVLAVFSGFIGLAVLFLFGVEAYSRVRSLGRTVVRASDRLARAGEPGPTARESDGEAAPNVW